MNPTVHHFIKRGLAECTAIKLAEAMERLHSAFSCMDKREQALVLDLMAHYGEEGSHEWTWLEDGLKAEANQPCNNRMEWLLIREDE